MQKLLLLLLSCLIAGPMRGQQSTQLFPTLGGRHIKEQGLIETTNSIFIPSKKFGVNFRSDQNPISKYYPNASFLYKYDKVTSGFTDSVRISGDTSNRDSISWPFFNASCYQNGKIYFLSSKLIFNNNANSTDGDRIFLTIVDTNLNVLLFDKMIVEPQKSPCNRLFKNMIIYQDKLFATYPCFESTGTNSTENSRLLLISIDGTYIKDTLAGIVTISGGAQLQPVVTGLIKEVGNDPGIYIGGAVLSNCNTCLYKTDENLNVLKNYGQLNRFPTSGPLGMIVNEDIFSTSFSDVINGQLFTAGEYLVKDPICDYTQENVFFTFVSKHRKADSFKRSSVLLIPNSSCKNHSSNDQYSHKILYSDAYKQLYYVNYNHVSGFGADTIQNEVQIVCVDTNLNLKWRKLISPKQNTIATTMQALLSENGRSLTIAGSYNDWTAPGDSTLSGTFLLRFDSAGLLSTGSNPQFTVRDRFTVYPNPATSTIWVEDIASVPAQAFIYDLVGRQVATYTLTGRKNRLELPAGKPGMYLLRIVPQWGEGWSQMVQVTE